MSSSGEHEELGFPSEGCRVRLEHQLISDCLKPYAPCSMLDELARMVQQAFRVRSDLYDRIWRLDWLAKGH